MKSLSFVFFQIKQSAHVRVLYEESDNICEHLVGNLRKLVNSWMCKIREQTQSSTTAKSKNTWLTPSSWFVVAPVNSRMTAQSRQGNFSISGEFFKNERL